MTNSLILAIPNLISYLLPKMQHETCDITFYNCDTLNFKALKNQ